MESKVVIIPSPKNFNDLKKKVKKINSPQAVHSMYKIGKSAGKDLYKQFIKSVRNREKRIERTFEILNMTDYGTYELKEISKNTIRILVKKSPLLKICTRSSEDSCHWICHWMSGLLSGIFSAQREEWHFEKVDCGSFKSHCEFVGKVF
jgi:predicted hydrocarbon binding protein